MYKQGLIDTTTSKKLVSFTSNANMSYILGTIGIGMFKSIKIGIILLISHFLSAIIIGIIYNPLTHTSIIQQKNTNSNSFCKIISPFDTLYKSILGSLKTLALIYSYTIIFSLIPDIIFKQLNITEGFKALICGIFEISNGINNVSLLNTEFELKLCIISFILSYSSLMVLMQIYSFVAIAKVKFKELVKFKLVQGVLSSAITYALLKFIQKQSISVFNNTQENIHLTNASTIYMLSIVITIILSMVIYRKKRHIMSPKKGDTH